MYSPLPQIDEIPDIPWYLQESVFLETYQNIYKLQAEE